MITSRTFKYVIPVAPALVVTAAALIISPADSHRSAQVSPNRPAESADNDKTALPHVTVNGQSVPIVPNGTTDFSTGNTHATVTTTINGVTNGGDTQTTTSPDGTVNITVNSSNGNNFNSSITSVNSFSSNSNSSQSQSSVNVVTTGGGQQVHVSN